MTRKFTETDRKALVPALRVFIRAVTGKLLPAAQAAGIVSQVLDRGITVDALLNRGNWRRALGENPELDAQGYADYLCRDYPCPHVTELKAEPDWHEPESGWPTVAEAAHDFYMQVTGKGGKFNTQSALMNLAKAVDAHSLQAILSEELIFAVTSADEPATFFEYIQAIADDFKSLPVNDALTAAQQQRLDLLGTPSGAPESPEVHDPDEDDPYPDTDFLGDAYHGSAGLIPDPMQEKRKSIANAIYAYSPQDILLLTETMVQGEKPLSLSEIVDRLTAGEFQPEKESEPVRRIHNFLSGDLTTSFIETVRMQQFEMDQDQAANYDILHDSWDFRNDEVRKVHKLKKLIYGADEVDPDLLAVLKDVERLYKE